MSKWEHMTDETVQFLGVAWQFIDCVSASQISQETVPSIRVGYGERTATEAGKGARNNAYVDSARYTSCTGVRISIPVLGRF